MAPWQELPAAGLYKVKLASSTLDVTCYPWSHNNIKADQILCHSISTPISLHNYTSLNKQLPQNNNILHHLTCSADPLRTAAEYLKDECSTLLRLLTESVFRRVGTSSYHCNSCTRDNNCGNSHISIMFSGGIDSMMLAHVVDRCLPETQPIDLLNVAFETTANAEKYDVPDRQTGLIALAELNPNRKWNFVEVVSFVPHNKISIHCHFMLYE